VILIAILAKLPIEYAFAIPLKVYTGDSEPPLFSSWRKAMSTEENSVLVQKWVEARNRHDVEAAVALWTEDQQEGIRTAFNGFSQTFPDIHITITELIATGDKVVGRFRMDATHLGPFRTIPATGKTVILTGIDIYTIVDGKLASLTREADKLSLMVQLGVSVLWQGQPIA
jgi:steroid delta-isomerase-like uncharacterized protein